MGYTNIITTMKWWYPHTKKLKYYSYTKFDEHNNKFGKGSSPGYELITGTNISTLPTLKIYISNLPFITYYIFEVADNFPPRSTTIGILSQ